MATRSDFRNPRQRRLTRGAERKAAWDKYNDPTPLWCHSCSHEITGKRRDRMQCHNCGTWNRVVSGRGYADTTEE